MMTLKDPIESIIESSFNPILTLAAFIVFNHPELKPPFADYEPVQVLEIVDENFPNASLSNNSNF